MQSIINLKKSLHDSVTCYKRLFDIRLETESKSYKDLI